VPYALRLKSFIEEFRMRTILFISLLAAACAVPAAAQSDPPQAPASEQADAATAAAESDTAGIEMPELIGGLGSIAGDVTYPPIAQVAGAEGRVVVTFVVNEAGAVEEAEVTAPVHPALDREALAAVRRARFVPAHRAGRPLRVRMALPVTFELPARRGA
jgi:TonB family protein